MFKQNRTKQMTESYGKYLFSQRHRAINPPHAEEEVRDGFTKEVVFGPSRITMNAASRRRGGSRASTQPRQDEQTERGRSLVGHLWFQVRRTVPVGVVEREAGGQTECTDRGWTIVRPCTFMIRP